MTLIGSIWCGVLAVLTALAHMLFGSVSTAETVTSQIKSVTLRSGVRLEYVVQGDPAGVPVVLLHGYTDSWRSFERVLPHLPASLRVFAVSQRGHGGSDRPAGEYRPQEFAADVAEFMEAMALPRAVIVGHSMGSTVAQLFAIDHADRVRALVLVGAFLPKPGNPAVREFWESVSKLTDPIDPAFAREFQQSTLAQPVPPEYLDAVVGESLKVPARVWKAALQPLLTIDFASALPRLTMPALIVWGDRDTFTLRSEQDALRAAIPGSTLVVYAGAGHSPQWEEPARFAAALSGFVQNVAARQGSAAK